jgi:integrase/recombinase XerC
MILWRRHTPKCKDRGNGREFLTCSGRCPLWADGEMNGKRFRKTLKTRDLQRAWKKLAALESPDAIESKPVPEATAGFLEHCHQLEGSTLRKYKNIVVKFAAFCAGAHIEYMDELILPELDSYWAGRGLARTTAGKELQTLRQFFGFCIERNWMRENLAKKIKPLKAKAAPVVPYTPAEVAAMIAACDAIGRGSYERLRARAMVLTLRYTGLRISDVATLERDRIHGGQILLHAQKNGGTIFLPVPVELAKALEAVPAPRGSELDPRYFFWNGITSRRAVVGIAERTMATVFEKSGVKDAHAHRFRHTLATDILVKGGDMEDVADVLGISSVIARRHYAKWTQARQDRITNLMQMVHPSGTFSAQTEKGAVN